MQFKKKAFTFIELIIVIIITAILSAIWYVSYEWYASQARDSRRVSDISDIKKSLWFYYMENSIYPLPDQWKEALYEWELLWTQWFVWDTVVRKLSKNLNMMAGIKS